MEEENRQQLRQLGLTLTLEDLNYYYNIKLEFNSYITIGQQKENFHKDKKLAMLWTNFMQDSSLSKNERLA
ncbi:hypothetical protein [Candidatus Tisiphia endosymbiont of Dioctria rufipes]|uniref:hypothetical protein n=1 Tax=Candidatus Tisiphia endosymbiont of Dioctria rufipes TaxID=3066255 RepID=UPI00312CC085